MSSYSRINGKNTSVAAMRQQVQNGPLPKISKAKVNGPKGEAKAIETIPHRIRRLTLVTTRTSWSI